ncbi:alpha/beta fold hydrolase [Halosegnis marinus]|uniref:Alpha/beta fold hydrolase n=1 Tax=Halosegnis marinus TaxID=3034023 RepID=A0ABD5ZRK4_9EURY|nr:alpha/beta hydrolase [Halosegnis sp. DT85]
MDHAAWTEAQESATVDVDGHAVEMAYYEAGPADAEPVVFLHGIPTWGFLWRGVAPALADEYRVVVPDLVGYGNSENGEGFDRSIRAQEGALASLLDALDVDRFHLVAHDIGGGVALRFAAHRPERVGKLVCSNVVCYDSWPVEFVSTLGLPRTASMDDDELAGQLDFAFADGAYGEADPDFVAGMKYPWLDREGGKRALARAAVSTNTNHTTEIPYGDITADLLCLWAEEDAMQPVSYGERLADEVGGDVVRLDEAFHWVPEDRAETYRSELRSFLGTTERDT